MVDTQIKRLRRLTRLRYDHQTGIYFTDNLLNCIYFTNNPRPYRKLKQIQQSNTKWRAYTADIPIIPLQNIRTILTDKSTKSSKSYLILIVRRKGELIRKITRNILVARQSNRYMISNYLESTRIGQT